MGDVVQAADAFRSGRYLGSAVDPVTRRLRFLSVSAVEAADVRPGRGGCARKWWYKYPGKMGALDRDRGAEAKAVGKRMHDQAAEYLRTGRMVLGPEAILLKPMMPPPGPDLLVEYENGGPDGGVLEVEGVPFVVKIDLSHARGFNWGGPDVSDVEDPPGTVEVCDWKWKWKDRTKSGVVTLLSATELAQTVQMSGYAAWAARVDPRVQWVRLSHGYSVKSPRYGRKVTRRFDPAEPLRTWEYVGGLVRSMRDAAAEIDADRVDANRHSCDSFGGCAYREVCSVGKGAPAARNLEILAGGAAAPLIEANTLLRRVVETREEQHKKDKEHAMALIENLFGSAPGAAGAPAAPLPSPLPTASSGGSSAGPPPGPPVAPGAPFVTVGLAPAPAGPTPEQVAQAAAALAAREAEAAAARKPDARAAWEAIVKAGKGTPALAGEAAAAVAAAHGQQAPASGYAGTGALEKVQAATVADLARIAAELAAPAPATNGPFPPGIAAIVPPDAPAFDPTKAAQPIDPANPPPGGIPAGLPAGAVAAPEAPAPAPKPKASRKKADAPAPTPGVTAEAAQAVHAAEKRPTLLEAVEVLRKSPDGWPPIGGAAAAQMAAAYGVPPPPNGGFFAGSGPRAAMPAVTDPNVIIALAAGEIAAATPAAEKVGALQTAPAPDHIMQFFEYAHLPEHLQRVSAPFGELAKALVESVPRNPERTVALRKLLEAKDAAVRAVVAK